MHNADINPAQTQLRERQPKEKSIMAGKKNIFKIRKIMQ